MISHTSVLQYAVVIIVLGTFQMGYNLSELNEPREAMSCLTASATDLQEAELKTGLPPCIPMSDAQYGLVTSLLAVGGLFGALGSAPLSNRHGRKTALALNSLGFVFGGVLKAAAINVAMLGFGRFISGLSSGAAAVLVPLFVNEIAPQDSQGKYGAFTQISINIGILVSQLLGLFCSKPQLWRLILVVGAVLGLVQAVLLLGIPESPKYLVSIGKREAARNSLARLRGPQFNIEDEIREEEPLTSSDAVDKVSVFDFLTKREHRKSAAVVCGLMFAQQMLGINAVIFHGVSVLIELLPTASGFINVIISIANLFFTMAASMFFDKISHKTLIVLSMSGMATFSFLLAMGMFQHVAVLSAVSCLLFVSSFSIGLGPLPYMVASKTVNYRAVNAAQASGLFVNWVGTFIVGFGVPVIAAAVGMRWVFIGFSVIGALSAMAVWKGVRAY